jgi:hypothetical protein
MSEVILIFAQFGTFTWLVLGGVSVVLAWFSLFVLIMTIRKMTIIQIAFELTDALRSSNSIRPVLQEDIDT